MSIPARRCFATLLPEDALPILSAKALLADRGREKHINKLASLVSVPERHFYELYRSPVERFAEFVQQIPASEAHHHAGPGGMLDHTLEVVMAALSIRRGYLLPPGSSVEIFAKKQDLWTYAVFTGSILHDIGKPLTDQVIHRYSMDVEAIGTWNPLLGPMTPGSGYYRVTFARRRAYRLHEKVAPMLASVVLPPAALAWLASDKEVLSAWLSALSGGFEEAGPLGEIINDADRSSVARDVSGEQPRRNRMPTARAIPLHERLTVALRHLLDEDELPLNRPGAAGWLVGDDLWLVVKRVLDAIRDYLTVDNPRAVPSRNDRLMDELQQHGILIPNGDRAVWSVTITQENWSQTLTMLRFSVQRIWPQRQNRPESFQGTVSFAGRAKQPANATRSEEALSASSSCGSGTETALADTPQAEITTASVSSPPPDVDNFVRTDSEEHGNGPKPVPSDDETGDPGRAFVEWLRTGVASGDLPINTVSARIHTVPEGLLLVSPGIFRDFHGQEWKQAQRRFQKLRLHERTPEGTNIFTYRVQGARRHSVIKGFLLSNPDSVLEGIHLPISNPHLTRDRE